MLEFLLALLTTATVAALLWPLMRMRLPARDCAAQERSVEQHRARIARTALAAPAVQRAAVALERIEHVRQRGCNASPVLHYAAHVAHYCA